ncbi:hypothetical protein ACF3NT_01510 [Naumannella halotolerans]|uniref:PspA-associated domain-containing protein n=1 Tax=Naumannella halotolerans TaxID=993414 RepID=A0A4R7J5W1_9ACTN|nr:hypothetical protein [Naumannella halotolerans]TDT32740.1 hypothetical protein CLV29_0327 [Naumannella halotolerans]
MIVRIVGEGQFRFPDSTFAQLEQFDDAIEKAVASADQAGLADALKSLHDAVIEASSPVADDELVESDLIIPAADASLDEVRALLDESNDGLIPNA